MLARADRDRDHVLREPLLVADAGIACRRQDVDEALVDDDLQPDVGIRGQERRHERWQDQLRRARRDVEPQRAGRPVAKSVDDVERRLDLDQRRPQPLEEPRAGLRRDDAARASMQQSHAQLRFQPAHASLKLDALTPPARAASRKPPARATETKAARSPSCSAMGLLVELFALAHGPSGFWPLIVSIASACLEWRLSQRNEP